MRVGEPDGHGRYAVLDRDDDGRLLCHECGRWWQHLATHVRAHGMTAADYRATHGLGTTTRLVGDHARARMRAAYDTHRATHLAALEQSRDIHAARAENTGQWAPEVRARRAAAARARRGRALSADETAWLTDADVDLQTWADRARALLAATDVSARSLAEACDIAPATVHQRLRRYPPRT